MASNNPHILGRWRIVEMDQWDIDYLDMEVEAFIEFDHDGKGSFQFGLVRGHISYELDGDRGIEWTWEGVDESEPASGRGKAELESKGILQGKFVFHRGDSSTFIADRATTKGTGNNVRAVNAKTGEAVVVDIASIRPGLIRNRTLPDDLLKRIRAIHKCIRDADDVTLEQFELNFMRDAYPEGEVKIWEQLAVAYQRVCDEWLQADRKMVLLTLLGYSMGALTEEELTRPDIRRIIGIIEGGEQAAD